MRWIRVNLFKDGLWFILQDLSIFDISSSIIITPNRNELKRMGEALGISEKISPAQVSERLNNCWVMLKDQTDIVTNSKYEFTNNLLGSPRRCGGQGDILCGFLATLCNWVSKNQSEKICEIPKYAAVSLVSSYIMRSLCSKVYNEKGIGMITSDLINQIPYILTRLTESCKSV
uniref:ATP-dependent NAD(P)H-hydrate dehydratase n=1 Tax=Henneguya salminicola TaxID=69463 RepID=A0A6G3MER5_HENSL